MRTPSPQADGSARLILVLSSERSGSTLLRVVLGEHSRIVAPSELFLMRYPSYHTWRSLKPVAVESLVEYFRLLGSPRTVAEIDATCRDWSTAEVYRWLLRGLPAGTFLVDKTPAYANSLDTMRRSLVLEPYYVWLIRHPLAIIESHVRIKVHKGGVHRLEALRQRLRDLSDGVLGSRHMRMEPLARLREIKWLLQQTNIHEFLASVPDRQKTMVHFEDFVQAPEVTLRRLCDGLGIAFEPSMLQVRLHDRKVNPDLGDPSFHTHARIERQKAYGWRRRFSENQLTIESLNLMRTIGVRSPLAGAGPENPGSGQATIPN